MDLPTHALKVNIQDSKGEHAVMISSARIDYLNGQLLIAMPTINDPRFKRSLIYLCSHSAEGAMGIIVNQVARNINFSEVLTKLNIVTDENLIEIPESAHNKIVHIGGPIDPNRGFVLHTSDYYIKNNTLQIDKNIYLTATLDILRMIVVSDTPFQSLLALGYTGWGPGQLEREIHENGWLHCPADPQLLFDSQTSDKYDIALARIGIDPLRFISEAGHS